MIEGISAPIRIRQQVLPGCPLRAETHGLVERGVRDATQAISQAWPAGPALTGPVFHFVLFRNGVTRSMGSGNMMVVFLSAPITVSVSR